MICIFGEPIGDAKPRASSYPTYCTGWAIIDHLCHGLGSKTFRDRMMCSLLLLMPPAYSSSAVRPQVNNDFASVSQRHSFPDSQNFLAHCIHRDRVVWLNVRYPDVITFGYYPFRYRPKRTEHMKQQSRSREMPTITLRVLTSPLWPLPRPTTQNRYNAPQSVEIHFDRTPPSRNATMSQVYSRNEPRQPPFPSASDY